MTKEITLHDAINRIAQELDNPYQASNSDGTLEVRNAWGWNQKRVLQAMASALYADLYDTRTYQDNRGQKRPRGLRHRLDQQMRYLKQLNDNCDMGNEIDMQQIIKAAQYTEDMQEQFAVMEDMYHTICNVHEEVTGDTLKPYQPWHDYKTHAKEQASSESAAAARAALARFGLAPKEGFVAQTDGVDTQERDVA